MTRVSSPSQLVVLCLVAAAVARPQNTDEKNAETLEYTNELREDQSYDFRSVRQSVSPSVRQFVSPSVRQSVSPSVRQSVRTDQPRTDTGKPRLTR